MMGDSTHTCENCGTEYESYPVLIPDDMSEIIAWEKRQAKYENLCEPCNDAYFSGEHGFDSN